MRERLAAWFRGAGCVIFAAWGLVSLVLAAREVCHWWGFGGLVVGVLLGPMTWLAFPFVVWWKTGALPWIWLVLDYGWIPTAGLLWFSAGWQKPDSLDSYTRRVG